MKKYFLIFAILSSFPYAINPLKQSNFDINNYFDGRFDANIFHLDYNRIYKSSFFLDKYFPNHFIDFNILGLTINGNMNESIYQLIPEKIFFDLNGKGKISQLSYHEKKSYDFFDTKIALKVDINDKLRFLGFAESKSFINNINQNYLLNIHKEVENNYLDISYMYHIDDAQIDYMKENINIECQPQNYHGIYYIDDNLLLDCMYDSFQKNNESFHLGIDYQRRFNKLQFNHNSAFQISNTKKDFISNENLNYNQEHYWYNHLISYTLNEKTEIYFKQHIKENLIENYSLKINNVWIAGETIDSYQNIFSVGAKYRLFTNYLLDLSYDILGYSSLSTNKYEKKASILFQYKQPTYILSIGSNNNILSNFYVDNQNENMPYDLFYFFYSKQFFGCKLKIDRLENNFEYGNIETKDFGNSIPYFRNLNSLDYTYLLLNTKLRFNIFSIDFIYRFYNTDYTYINEYVSLDLTVSPQINNVRFRPYGKIMLNSVTINSMYTIDLKSTNLFDYDLEKISEDDNQVNIIKGELGIMFDSFKISYKIMNPFNKKYSDEVQYSDNILPHLGKHSTINILWIFKD